MSMKKLDYIEIARLCDLAVKNHRDLNIEITAEGTINININIPTTFHSTTEGRLEEYGSNS